MKAAVLSPRIRILVFGATGRMGKNRHLVQSLLVLRSENFDLDITLVGRNYEETLKLSTSLGCKAEPDLASCLNSEKFDIYFDCAPPQGRAERVSSAIKAGLHVFCEKPLVISTSEFATLARLASDAGSISGVVADKKFTPGFKVLQKLLDERIIGQIYDVNCEFGYWVSPGFQDQKLQRPSWNYMKSKGGSLISDIFSHWSYLLELIGPIEQVFAFTSTHIKMRVDESGDKYISDVPDTAHILLKFENKATGRISTSWLFRPAKPFTIEISGEKASVRVTPTSAEVIMDNGETYDALAKYKMEILDEFYLQWKEYLECFLKKKQPSFDFSSSLASAILCECIEQSVSTGLPVFMSEIEAKYK